MANPNWGNGRSGNPAGRPKTAFKENFDQLTAKKKMFEEATQILSERWADVFHAMCDQAIKGNPQAAAFIANYVLGKPKESIDLDLTSREGLKIVISKEENAL
jgi:Family of unknown function (DUF5681)